MSKCTLISVNGNLILVSFADGSPNKQLTVANDASISRNGQTVLLSDLQAGDTLSYSGDPITSLTATGVK